MDTTKPTGELAESPTLTPHDIQACIRLFGKGATLLKSDFQQWIVASAMSRMNFEAFVDLALDEEEEDHITYDDNTLDLNFHSVRIWFDAFRFEAHVGSRELNLAHINEGPFATCRVEAREYLKENWRAEARDFIMANLRYAEVEKLEAL